MVNIIKSVLVTSCISLGLAFSLRDLLGFWEIFTLSFILQFLVSFLWKNFTLNNNSAVITELTQNFDSLIETQQINIPCPCGKYTENIIFSPKEDITIQCEACKNTFRVVTEIKTQLITEPVNIESMFDKLKGTTV